MNFHLCLDVSTKKVHFCTKGFTVVDLHSRILDAPLPSRDPNSFNFMQFLGKFGKIVCMLAPSGGLAPLPRGKSWIRHWFIDNSDHSRGIVANTFTCLFTLARVLRKENLTYFKITSLLPLPTSLRGVVSLSPSCHVIKGRNTDKWTHRHLDTQILIILIYRLVCLNLVYC